MKSEIKKWLSLHKGKPLTKEMIEMIAQKHEEEIGQMLYEDAFALESRDTGKQIEYCRGEEDWQVTDGWGILREYKTLAGAVKFALKPFGDDDD